jgi:hypothetical protein
MQSRDEALGELRAGPSRRAPGRHDNAKHKECRRVNGKDRPNAKSGYQHPSDCRTDGLRDIEADRSERRRSGQVGSWHEVGNAGLVGWHGKSRAGPEQEGETEQQRRRHLVRQGEGSQ